jgi:hypothetical protein
MYPFLKDAPFRPCFCFVHTIAQFSRIFWFSHIYCQIFRIVPFVDGSRYTVNGPLRPLNSEFITSTIALIIWNRTTNTIHFVSWYTLFSVTFVCFGLSNCRTIFAFHLFLSVLNRLFFGQFMFLWFLSVFVDLF